MSLFVYYIQSKIVQETTDAIHHLKMLDKWPGNSIYKEDLVKLSPLRTTPL